MEKWYTCYWVQFEALTKNSKEKIEHLVHETWPQTCGWIVFKFYKKQMKSENHEISQCDISEEVSSPKL